MLVQGLGHYRLVVVPKAPGPYIRGEVLASKDRAPLDYHVWYYNSNVWRSTTWLGVKTLKSVSDMWNYQEILFDLVPSLVVEFGAAHGGSALFFATVMENMRRDYRVLTVDVACDLVDPRTLNHPRIEVLKASSTSRKTAEVIHELRRQHPGPVFAILDSDHSKAHVLGELELITPLLRTGDYLVVEDSNVNGHPVYPDHGPGPYEALEEFLATHPNTYRRDEGREKKFGFTFAPKGFLLRS
jgi:cephalosporin hydroxylase